MLPRSPMAAGQARRVTGTLCRAACLDDDLCDTAVLLTSEVVTNAVLHGRSPSCLSVAASELGVRVEVEDDSSRWPVQRQQGDSAALDGRGILLLETIATSWGVLPGHAGGKVVWFEVNAP